jgi:hypothetical protein
MTSRLAGVKHANFKSGHPDESQKWETIMDESVPHAKQMEEYNRIVATGVNDTWAKIKIEKTDPESQIRRPRTLYTKKQMDESARIQVAKEAELDKQDQQVGGIATARSDVSGTPKVNAAGQKINPQPKTDPAIGRDANGNIRMMTHDEHVAELCKQHDYLRSIQGKPLTPVKQTDPYKPAIFR